MATTRRKFIATLVAKIAAVGIIVAAPRAARACLIGTWKVRCPNGHDNTVDEITCNHTCDKCHAQAFKDGEGNIVCPNYHVNHVSTGNSGQKGMWIRSYACSTCKAECCIKQLQTPN
jgi:hypothetical protein